MFCNNPKCMAYYKRKFGGSGDSPNSDLDIKAFAYLKGKEYEVVDEIYFKISDLVLTDEEVKRTFYFGLSGNADDAANIYWMASRDGWESDNMISVELDRWGELCLRIVKEPFESGGHRYEKGTYFYNELYGSADIDDMYFIVMSPVPNQ